MLDPMLPLPGLSPVSGKTVVAKFDGGLLSSDGGVLVLREVERRLRVADRLAACMVDPRAPDLITHNPADILRFRLLMITPGYEDGNDASSLRGGNRPLSESISYQSLETMQRAGFRPAELPDRAYSCFMRARGR